MKPFSIFFLAAAVLISALISRPSRAAVWTETEQWSPEWEARYADWTHENLNVNFFMRAPANPAGNNQWWQGAIMDCADAVYGIRVVFAAEHGLPFAVRDSTRAGGGVISNRMSRWDNLAEPQRKRAFLQYIMGVTSTVTMPNDTYPVDVTRETLRGGVVLLTDPKSHHSWTVREVSDVGVPHLVFSTRPARTLLLERFGFPSVGFLFQGAINPARGAGFRAWRPASALNVPVWEVPGASRKQYEFTAGAWASEMQKHLAASVETTVARVERMLADACKGAVERVAFVNEGIAALARIGARCMNESEYDDFSTPSRDGRLKDAFNDLAAAARGQALPQALREKVEAVLAGDASIRMPGAAYCPVTIETGRTLSLGQVYARSLGAKLSNNPHDPLSMRWGEALGHSERARRCRSW